MASGVEHPTVNQLLDIAASLGIPLTEPEAAEYRSSMGAGVRYCRELEQLPEHRPPVKYPRTPGLRPEPEDNPHNAWYCRAEIQGAGEGPLKGYTVGIKDAICVAGVPAMNGSRVLEGYIPDVDSTVVTRLVDAYDQVLASYDIIAMPSVAFRATELPPPDCSITEYLQHAASAVGNTCQFCITGHPSISVPCATADGPPVGLMLTGRHFELFTVLRAADAFEKLGDWREM